MEREIDQRIVRDEPGLSEVGPIRPAEVASNRKISGLPTGGGWWADNRRQVLVRATQLLVVVAFIAIWGVAAGRWVPELFVSTPGEVAENFIAWILDGTLLYNGWFTLDNALRGFVIGAALAVVVGYILAVNDFWARVFEPMISALWGLPRVALVPVLIVWLGIGRSLSVSIAAIVVFFLTFFNTYYGIRDVRPGLINAMRLMGGGKLRVALQVQLPSALVWIVTGLKLSAPMSLTGVVFAEMMASNRGLGYLVAFHGGQFNMAAALSALLGLAIIGLGLTRIVMIASNRALLWKSEGSPLA